MNARPTSREAQLDALFKEHQGRGDALDSDGTPIIITMINERYGIEHLDAMLAKNLDVNCRDGQGRSLLGHLLAARQPRDSRLEYRDRPLTLSTESHLKIEQFVVKILHAGADINLADDQGITPFMLASRFASQQIFERCLDFRPDIETEDEAGWNALMHACAGGYFQSPQVKRLLELGLSAASRAGNISTLFLAAQSGGRESVALLQGANDFSTEDTAGALWEAAWQNHVDIVRDLLDRGASPDVTDDSGRSALQVALQPGRNALASALIAAGANVNHRDDRGHTPLIAAAAFSRRDIDLLKMLLNHGADPNYMATDGYSALLTAAANYSVAGIDLLLEHGADLNAVNEVSYTPLMNAARACHWQGCSDEALPVFDLLVEKTADINLTDNQGYTALAFLCGANNNQSKQESPQMVYVAERLLASGADPDIGPENRSARMLARQKGLRNILKLMPAQAM